MNIQKVIKIILTFVLICCILFMMSGCGENSAEFNEERMITVVSREDGSGTRGAFVELMGIEERRPDGTKTDRTTKEAIIASKTDVVLTNIAGDKYAIGYVSLGSLNDSVKAVMVDGVAPTFDTVKNGSYKVARPFYLATRDGGGELAQDFIKFILSAEGQEIVADGYVSVADDAQNYEASAVSGRLVVSGSSSVAPVMEKLKEAYSVLNPNARIEIQMTDSTSGMTGVIEGTCDIGMASRELRDSEREALVPTVIAMDGIAVIVNKDNPVNSISAEDIKEIYTGEDTEWDDVD